MRLTATSDSMSFLGAAVGSIRPRPLSPLFGGSLSVPIAVGVVGAAAGFEGAGMVAGFPGAIKVCLGAVAVAWAIGAAVSSTFAASAASVSASALAWVIAS